MSTKKEKELAKALDIVEDALEASTDKEIKEVVAASDEFEETTKDKALAEKVDSIVNKVVDDAGKTDKVEEVKDETPAAPTEPERVRRTEEEKAAWLKERLKTVSGRGWTPE